MANIIELSLCAEDRKKHGGPEWVPLDLDRLRDTESVMLRRWEAETNYPIELAVEKIGSGAPPAVATQTLVWLARKQTGEGSDEQTGLPESFAALNDIKTMRVSARPAATPEVDADPPEQAEPTETAPQP